MLVNLIIRKINNLESISILVDIIHTHIQNRVSSKLIVKIEYSQEEEAKDEKDLIGAESRSIGRASEQVNNLRHFSNLRLHERSNTDPRFKYELAARSQSVKRLEKDVKNCEKLTDMVIWTEREEVTNDYYPLRQSNLRLVVNAMIPLKEDRHTRVGDRSQGKLTTIKETSEVYSTSQAAVLHSKLNN